MGFIKRAWHGDIKLWKIFWVFGLLFPMVLGVVFYIVLMPVIIIGGGPGMALLSGLLFPLFMFPYFVWWLVATWRAAFNCGFRLWGYLARIWVALASIGWVAQIAIGVTMMLSGDAALQDMQKAAQQMEQMQQNMGTALTESPVTGAVPLETAPITPTVETAPADAMAPAAAPVAETAMPAPVLNPAEQQCTDKLRAHAAASGVDADAYVAQNQAWVAQCVQKLTVAQ